MRRFVFALRRALPPAQSRFFGGSHFFDLEIETKDKKKTPQPTAPSLSFDSLSSPPSSTKKRSIVSRFTPPQVLPDSELPPAPSSPLAHNPYETATAVQVAPIRAVIGDEDARLPATSDSSLPSAATSDPLDPFLSPQLTTLKMYRDLITATAKTHLPESAPPMKFPQNYFLRMSEFAVQFNLDFNNRELLLRALTHRSYAVKWLAPAECVRTADQGGWQSSSVLQSVAPYEQVINVISNSSLATLGNSLFQFLVHSYLFQKYPTISAEQMAQEVAQVLHPALITGLATQHFKLYDNHLILLDPHGITEEQEKLIARQTFYALVGAVYLDSGIAGVSEWCSNEALPALFTLKQSFDKKVFASAVSQLDKSLAPLQLTATYRVTHVVNPKSRNTEYIVGVFVNDQLLGEGRGTSFRVAKNYAARAALVNESIVGIQKRIERSAQMAVGNSNSPFLIEAQKEKNQ